MKPPTRFLIFAVLGPAAGLGSLAVLSFVDAILRGRSAGATGVQVFQIFHYLLSPRWLLILAPFALASWGAAALSLKAQASPGRSTFTRMCAAFGALLLVSPLSMLLAFVGFGNGPWGIPAALITSTAALTACWLACRLNERRFESAVRDAFA